MTAVAAAAAVVAVAVPTAAAALLLLLLLLLPLLHKIQEHRGAQGRPGMSRPIKS